MSETSAEYKWRVVVQKIQEIESRIDLENKTTDLYDPKFCYPDNDGCSHNIGEFVSTKKENLIQLVLSPNVHRLTKGFINGSTSTINKDEVKDICTTSNFFLPSSKNKLT